MIQYLEFEKPLAEIEGKAEELRAMARDNEEMDVEKEAAALDKKAADLLTSLYKSLTPWRKCQVARHPDRPHCKDYIEALFTEYTPLAGDRNFADDHAVMGGIARLDGRPVMVIGHEKGIELARLQLACKLPDCREIEIGVVDCSRIAPSTGVNADRPHEGAEVKLAKVRHNVLLA